MYFCSIANTAASHKHVGFKLWQTQASSPSQFLCRLVSPVFKQNSGLRMAVYFQMYWPKYPPKKTMCHVLRINQWPHKSASYSDLPTRKCIHTHSVVRIQWRRIPLHANMHTLWQGAMCGTNSDVHSFVPCAWLRQAEVIVQQMTFAPSNVPPSLQQHPPPSSSLISSLFLLSLLYADEKRMDNKKPGCGLWSRNKIAGWKLLHCIWCTFSNDAQSYFFKMTTVTTHGKK